MPRAITLQVAGNRLSGPFSRTFATTNDSFTSLMTVNWVRASFDAPLCAAASPSLSVAAALECLLLWLPRAPFSQGDNQFTGTLPNFINGG